MNPAQGTWYSTTNLTTTFPGTQFACAFMAAGCDASWSEILTDYPAAKIRFGLGPNVGTGGTFIGNIDNFTVGVSGATTVYDFEPDCTTDCYVDAATGNDFNSGLPGDPVKTIQKGVDKVTAGGTVHVAAGTYPENVTINKVLSLKGAQAGVDVGLARIRPHPALSPSSRGPAPAIRGRYGCRPTV